MRISKAVMKPRSNKSETKKSSPAADAARAVRTERLWVPLLTHFDNNGGIDKARTATHIRALRPYLSGFLLAGSTGAGWKVNDSHFQALLELAYDAFDAESLILVGCLRPTTGEVIARAQRAEALYRSRAPKGRYVGLTVCAPVGSVSQKEILDHFKKIMDATQSPLAVYQLPQVTHRDIDPETMRELVKSGRVHMFKDTSGEDRVADSGGLGDSVWMLRGAEGGYFEALKPSGPYDGWLLSTANGLAPHYREIVRAAQNHDDATARELSSRITDAVTRIFRLAGELNAGNPFSNANRAIDQVEAYGADCLTAPMPRRVDGSLVPVEFVRQVYEILRGAALARQGGYL